MATETALQRLLASEKAAREFGFEWPHEQMIIDYVFSECHEVLDAIEQNEPASRIQEEIGDLLHAVISLCIFAGFDVEQTLDKTNDKFSARMAMLKQISREKGLTDLAGKPVDFQLELWQQAKIACAGSAK